LIKEEGGGKGMQIWAYTCLYKPFEVRDLSRIIEEISRANSRPFWENRFLTRKDERWTSP
jgi:hypothetical protein